MGEIISHCPEVYCSREISHTSMHQIERSRIVDISATGPSLSGQSAFNMCVKSKGREGSECPLGVD